MTSVTLNKTKHHGVEVVYLQFPRDEKIQQELRKIKHARWSNTLKAWQLPYSIEVLHEIKNKIGGISEINAQPLKETIAKERNEQNKICRWNEVKNNFEVVTKKLTDYMRSRRYSENTISTYCDSLKSFLLFHHDKCMEKITNDDIIEYNNKYILANNLSSSFQNQVINAIKLYLQVTHNKTIQVELIHRPRRSKVLPNVLSKEEVKLILTAHANIKHKSMLSLIYSCGLRCGELIGLKPENIDKHRGVIIIKQAKGRKDRIAPLSAKIISMIEEYQQVFKPKLFLFEGQKPGEPYDARSLQQVLKQSLVKAKITKPVSLHWLRHSYATHLLENGTDLRYIQEILGHTSSRTTEIYTHVSTKNIQKIISPFDYL